MRKQLLLSTGIICLMLAPAVSYGQAPGAKGEEQKQMRPSDTGKGGAASQERGAERAQERGQGAEQRKQGAAGREDRGAGSRQSEERGKAAPSGERPATASDDKRGRGEDAKSRERAQDSRQGGRDAQTAREGKDAKDAKDSKGSAEMDRDKARGKSTAEQEKSKAGTTSTQREREGTTTTQKEQGRDQRDSSKDAAERDKDAGRPSTATDTTRTPPSGQTTQSQTGQTQAGQQSNISTEKQVRISQTLTRERLAPPERNLNIAIRIGEPAPRSVRFHRLPREIVSIEPEYRDYEYFTTDDDIVIVEPRSKRIVSQVPRDASRIRAAGGASDTGSTTGTAGYTSSMAAAGGASPCRIMRRDTAGNVTELTPQTVGSTAQQEAISVTVRVPGGASTAPIALGAADGQIVVSGQSGADCMVTIEPPAR
jgi:hypothetical protein